MTGITQFINIPSQLAESIRDFYLEQESECEYVPLAPLHDGHQLKGSDIYVEMQLLVDRIQLPEINLKEGEKKGQKDPAVPSSPFKKSVETSISKSGYVDELAESRYEDFQENTKQREFWKKIFRGTRLRLIFKGGAGSGKSFTLSQEVRQRLAKARIELESLNTSLDNLEIAIFVKANDLVNSKKESIEDAILESLSVSSRSLLTHQLKNWIHHAFTSENGRRLFIVIDGLDELPEYSQDSFRNRMKQFDTQLKSASLIVSCRTMYLDERRNWISWAGDQRAQVVELAPLEETQQSELIGKLIGFNNNSIEKLLDLLKKNYSLNHFCRSPLIMGLACWLYAKEKNLSEKTNYASLYKAIIKMVLKGGWKKLAKTLNWMALLTDVERDKALDDRMSLLSQICWYLFEESPSENRFTRKQWEEAYKKISNKYLTDFDPIQLLSELELVGMIIGSGYYAIEDKHYSFAHRTLLEYCAACGLIEQHKEAVWTKILADHMWCETAWIEVIRFAASITEHSTQLLRKVVKDTGNSPPKARPLQKLRSLFSGLDSLIILFSILFTCISVYMIWSLNDFNYLAGKLLLHGKLNFGNLLSLLSGSWNALTLHISNLFNARGSFINSLGNLLYWLISGIFRYCLLFKDTIVSTYNFIFQFLHRQSLNASGTMFGSIWGYLVDEMYILTPTLIIVLLALRFLSRIADWLDRKLFYRINFVEKDDIFQTGLRVQAEIIGHSRGISDIQTKKIIGRLLDATKMYGAKAGENIPADLILLLGSNKDARRILNDYWMGLVNKRRKYLSRCNRIYRYILSVYILILNFFRPRENFLFKAGDLKKVRRLSHKLSRDEREYSETRAISTYISNNFTPETKRLIKDYSKESKGLLINNLVDHFNMTLEDPYLYNDQRFQKITLRSETQNLLKQNPDGKELMYLNRLLLEDAYPEIRKIQKKWLRFVSWIGRNSVKEMMMSTMYDLRSSDLFGELQGLLILNDKRNIDSLSDLLRLSSITTKYLHDAKRTTRTFTALDIYVNGLLARLGDLPGRERLIEIANRTSERNYYTPLAVKELSLVDERRAIELIVNCIKNNWENIESDRYPYDDSQRHKFRELLYSLPFKLVTDEFSRLIIENPDEDYYMVVSEYLRYSDHDMAKEWLQKMAESDELSLAIFARRILNNPSEKSWVNGKEWLEEKIDQIGRLINEKDLDAATVNFNDIIGYYWVYVSDYLLNDSEMTAALFNKYILDKWFDKLGGYWSYYRNLGGLAKKPGGESIKTALFEWAEDKEVRHPYKGKLLLALLDPGDSDAEKFFMQSLQEFQQDQRSISNYIKNKLADTTDEQQQIADNLVGGLAKLGNDEAIKQIKSILNSGSWISYYIAARFFAQRDDPQSLELFLAGESKKRDSKEKWDDAFGDEPKLRDLAVHFGARITKVYDRGYWEHVVISNSRKYKCRVRV